MMTRRKRLIIVLLILLILLLLVIWLLFVLFSKPPSVQTPVTTIPAVVEEPTILTPRPTISDQELETERETRTVSADVVSLSKSFVTRYGSYSNEANFANLTDVLPLMSSSFAQQTREFIETAEMPQTYYGVSTTVITVKVDEKDETAGTAKVTITTQREEAIGSPQNTSVKFQDIIITFVMEDGSWKVDSATWQ